MAAGQRRFATFEFVASVRRESGRYVFAVGLGQCAQDKQAEIDQIKQKMESLFAQRSELLDELTKAGEADPDKIKIQSFSEELQAKYLELSEVIVAELERRKQES